MSATDISYLKTQYSKRLINIKTIAYKMSLDDHLVCSLLITGMKAQAAHATVIDQPFSYKRRSPEESVLYKVLAENLETFIEQREMEGSSLPAYIKKELREYLRCGIIQYGFVRCMCRACGHEKIVAYSCKRRGFCPSCGSKRMAESAAHLVENILPHATYRQWVVTYPYSLRFWMSANRTLFSKVQKITTDTILEFYEKKAKKEGLTNPKGAAVAFTHMFGSLVNLNIHQHILFLDGVFDVVVEKNKKTKYKKLSPLTDGQVADVSEKIAKKVIKYLQAKGYIDKEFNYEKLIADIDPLIQENESLAKIIQASCSGKIAFGKNAGRYVQKIGKGFGYLEEIPLAKGRLCFSVNGFTVHAQRKIKPHRRDQLEELLQYMGRASISSERLTQNDDGTLTYKLKREFSDGTTAIRLGPEELIEKLVSIIPLPRVHLTRYCGAFAPASPARSSVIRKPGRKKGMSLTICDDSRSDDEKTKVKNTSWAIILARVFKINISICPDCGGEMVVMGMVQNPDEVSRYLKHVGISTRAPPIAEAKIKQIPLEFDGQFE